MKKWRMDEAKKTPTLPKIERIDKGKLLHELRHLKKHGLSGIQPEKNTKRV